MAAAISATCTTGCSSSPGFSTPMVRTTSRLVLRACPAEAALPHDRQDRPLVVELASLDLGQRASQVVAWRARPELVGEQQSHMAGQRLRPAHRARDPFARGGAPSARAFGGPLAARV